jgi:hypothetical protein
MILNEYPIKPQHGKIPTSQQLQYTQVLTKQSLLFNVWKEMCRLFDTEGISIRVQPTFVAQPGIPEKTITTIGLVGDLDGSVLAAANNGQAQEVVPKVVRVRKTTTKKPVKAAITTSASVAGATLGYTAHETAEGTRRLVKDVGATQVDPTLLAHQDTKKKTRTKKSDVQGAVLVL